MKLKLEVQDNATILCVTEDIAAHHISVLKAGLNKLIQSGKKSILLDITQLATSDINVLQEISNLQIWAQEAGAQMIIAHPQPMIGHASTRQEGLHILSSSIARILALESKLQAHLRRLQKQRSEMETRLQTLGGSDDLKKLQRENSDLKKITRNLELQIHDALKARIPVFESDLYSAKNDSLNKLLELVLSQQGILTTR